MRTLLWLVWDLLTHRTYRVKIVKYDFKSKYIPQVRYSIFPIMWWKIAINHYYNYYAEFSVEYFAWDFIHEYKVRQKAGRPIEVKFKYKE